MYQLDHIVHFVAQPEKAVEALQNEGLHVVAGGKHEAWGTYNALSYFDLSYIEFIGIYDEELFTNAAQQKYTLHASYANKNRTNGLTRFAISTTSIEEDAKKFQAEGFEVFGPEAYSRTREDGSVVSWQLLHIGHPTSKVELPFFIQWDEEEQVRRDMYTERGIIAPHKLGDLKLQEIHYIMPNFNFVEQLAKLCEATVEMKEDADLVSELAIVTLQNVRLIFIRPVDEGPIWDEMLERGCGIQKIVLSGGNETKDIVYDGALYEVVV